MNRHPMKTATLIVAMLAAAGIVGVGSAVSSTQAAWSDRVHVAARVSAGTWGSNTCTAWTDDEKSKPVTCTITQVTMTPWGNGPRDYMVSWSTDPEARWVRFTVDLSTATRTTAVADDPAWSWRGATVRAPGAQFTPIGEWTCADLPVVRGQSLLWGKNAYFVVQPASSTDPRMCG